MPVASEEGYLTYDGTHNGRGVYASTFAPTLSRRVVDDCADVGERVQEWGKNMEVVQKGGQLQIVDRDVAGG